MKRCIECGRPYREGLKAPALLELALDELKEGELEAEHPKSLARMRETLRRAAESLDSAMEKRAAAMANSR